MEDIIFLLLAALVLFLLMSHVFGGGSTAASSAYQSNLIGGAATAAQNAATAVAQTVASFGKELGNLTAAVDRNYLAGYAKTGQKNPVAKPSPQSFQNENTNTAVNAVKTGLSVGGNGGLASAIPSFIINAFSGLIQGASSAAQSDYKNLPAVHGVEHAIGTATVDVGKGIGRAASAAAKAPVVRYTGTVLGDIGKTVGKVDTAAAKFAAKQANNFTNWIGHVL